MPGSGPNPAGPSPRFADRPSPHQPQQNTQLTGNQQPGGSGEICRKFLAGRCTFGDRCWYVSLLCCYDEIRLLGDPQGVLTCCSYVYLHLRFVLLSLDPTL